MLGGAALLVSSWVVVVATDGVPAPEVWVFETINDLSDFAWPVVWGPMQVGSFVGSLVVVAATYGVTRNKRLTLATLVASQAAFWIARGVKDVVSRGRPAALLSDVDVRDRATGLGYVSGHTAVAFALATALAPSLPRRWRPVAFAVAAVVGVSRVYAGAHLPLDVVGGAGIGILAGTFSRWAFGLGGEGLPATPIVPDHHDP